MTQHAFLITSHNQEPEYEVTFGCFNKLLEGYKNWTINEVCNGSIADVTFAFSRTGVPVNLSALISYVSIEFFYSFKSQNLV